MAKKIIFIGYSWSQHRKIDFYQQGLVNAFSDLGYEVHIISINEICPKGSVIGISKDFSSKKFSEVLESIKPDFLVSMNHAGLFNEVLTSKKYPIMDLIVDELSHLFIPDALIADNFFSNNTFIITTNSRSYKHFRHVCPKIVSDHVSLSPCVSDLLKNPNVKQKYNISFIGSFLETAKAEFIFWKASIHKDKEVLKNIIALMAELTHDYHADFDKLVTKHDLNDFFKELALEHKDVKYYLSNHISSRLRLDTITKLSSLGLRLYGNDLWLETLSHTPKVLECFRPGSLLTSRDELCHVYNSSKLSIHISQVQVPGSLSYRIYDIMKSNSLLILPWNKNSDAFTFFGKDCPIPMYKDLDHLYKLCEYYLDHEDERLELVKKCNDLVTSGFSYQDSAQQMLKLANLNFESNGLSSTTDVKYVSSDQFKKSLFDIFR